MRAKERRKGEKRKYKKILSKLLGVNAEASKCSIPGFGNGKKVNNPGKSQEIPGMSRLNPGIREITAQIPKFPGISRPGISRH